jgi:uncharacterized protein YerC
MVELAEAILGLQSQAEVSALLNLLFTPTELKVVSNRWLGCQMALGGSTQRSIRASLGMGNSTAARCARVAREAHPDFEPIAVRLGLAARPSITSSGTP